MRHEGQGFEIEVPVPAAEDPQQALDALPALFKARYAELFAVTSNDQPIQVVKWRVAVTGPRPANADSYRLPQERASRGALKGTRPALFGAADPLDCPVYDRYALAPGVRLTGPAL